MKSRTILISLIAGFALLLSACSVEFTDGPGPTDPVEPFPNAQVVAANTNPAVPVRTATLGPDDSVVYEVLLDSQVRQNPAMIFEIFELEIGAVSALNAVLYNSSGSALASSANGRLFEEGRLALSASTSLGSLGIRPVPLDCQGPCIVRDADRASFFLEVINPTMASVSFEAYLYTGKYGDTNEPQNDNSGTPTTLTTLDTGAIEDLGDRDYWIMDASGLLEFDANPPEGLELRLGIVGSDVPAIRPGEDVPVFEGETVVVFELNGDAAADPSASDYSLNLN